jgi:hypothetical protein
VRCALIATTGGIWLGLFSSEEINSAFANKRERFLIQIKKLSAHFFG